MHSNGRQIITHIRVDFTSSILKTLHVPVVEKKIGEQHVSEYQEEHITDRLYLPLLKIAYRYFVVKQMISFRERKAKILNNEYLVSTRFNVGYSRT